MIFDIFGDNINCICEAEKITYFIKSEFYNTNIGKSIIQYNLLPIPINANGLFFVISSEKKYIHLPDCRNPVYNSNQGQVNDINQEEYNIALGLEDLKYFI
jgi:hypothetical protein